MSNKKDKLISTFTTKQPQVSSKITTIAGKDNSTGKETFNQFLPEGQSAYTIEPTDEGGYYISIEVAGTSDYCIKTLTELAVKVAKKTLDKAIQKAQARDTNSQQ